MQISYQLFSSRNGGDWAQTFAMLAEAGITKVEGFGGLYDDPADLRRMLDAAGLEMPSGHFFPLDTFEAGMARTIDVAQTVGMTRLFCPAPDLALQEGAEEAAWVDLAQRLQAAAETLRDAGLRMGWHNHAWEFAPLPSGKRPMQVILDHAPLIEWEIDLAWVVRGNADPMDWLREQGHRITAAHVKDIAPEGTCLDEDGWADLGEGVLDWGTYLAALKTIGVDLFVLEHDNPSDPARFARRSAAAFRTFAS